MDAAMSRIIAFPLARATARRAADVTTLAIRLDRIERTETGDEALMALVADAEAVALDALAGAPARDQAEVTVKLATLLRRVEADDDGFGSAGEIALLRSALRDMRRLARNKAVATG
jgi:hypothetical protein